MRHILRTFLLSSTLVVSAWAVDIVGIETVQFNALLNQIADVENVLDDEVLNELTDIHSVSDDIEQNTLDNVFYTSLINSYLKDGGSGEGIVETNKDINATLVHVDEDLHEILEALGELNITQQAILVAEEGDNNVSVSVTVDQNGTINAIEALDLQGVIDAVNNGRVAIVAKNDQIRSEIMTNTAQGVLLNDHFDLINPASYASQVVSGVNAGALLLGGIDDRLHFGDFQIPQPLDVTVVGGAVELGGTAEVDLSDIKTAAEALQAIANDGNNTDRANALRSIIDQILSKAYVVGAVEEQGWTEISAAVTADMPSVAESQNGVGTMVVDVWERGGGLQSYDLFDTSAYYAGIPSLESFANWVKAGVGVLVLALYWKYNWLYLNRVMALKITAVETNPVTNHGGSFGGVINFLLKGTRIGIVTIAIPVFIASVVLMFEVGAGQSIWAAFNAGVGDVVGAGAPTYAQRAWDFLSAFIPIETIQTLLVTFTVGWMFVMTKMFSSNRVLRAAS